MSEFSESSAEEAGKRATEAAKDIKSAVADKVDEMRSATQEGAESLAKQLEAYVRQDPLKAALFAVSLGIVIGFIVRK